MYFKRSIKAKHYALGRIRPPDHKVSRADREPYSLLGGVSYAMSFPFEYLTNYGRALGMIDAEVGSVSAAVDLVSSYDEKMLPMPSGGDGLRSFALCTLKLSFLSVLTEDECNAYISEVSKADKIAAQDMAHLTRLLTSSSLCDGDFAKQLIQSSLLKGARNISFEHAVVISQLALRTEMLLSSGGDDRLTLKMNGGRINKYFCSTLPRSYVLRRGSCTCSTTTMAQFDLAERNRIAMLSKALSVADKSPPEACMDAALEINDDTRFRLGKSLGIDTTDLSAHQIVLFPSGSDAELLPVCVAMSRKPTKIFNFVTAAGEVGSGTPNAANVRHFSSLKTMGGTQENNGPLLGYDGASVELIEVKPRKIDGSTDFREQETMIAIDTKLQGCPGSVAILHLVLGSKTGLICPSRNFIADMRAKFGSSLMIVADACQLRCTASFIKSLVDDDIVCLITGSKFFSGPPFSGAVLLPSPMAQEIETSLASPNTPLPRGLNMYLTPYECPKTMPYMRKFLDIPSQDAAKKWINPGLALRWICGVQGIEDFYSIPPAVVDAFVGKWVAHTKDLVRQCEPYLQVLDVDLGDDGNVMVGGSNSIVSIILNVSNGVGGTRRLTADECKVYHQLMGKDCSDMFVCDSEAKGILKQTAMLGQTVKLSSILSIVRIALGADMVNEALAVYGTKPASPDPMQMAFDIARVMEVDQIVIRKMALLARLWFRGTSKVVAMRELDSAFGDSITTASVPIANVTMILEVLKTLPHVPNSTLVYDLDAIDASILSIKDTFNAGYLGLTDANFLHAFAVKSCPLSYIVHRFVTGGLGMECASIVEVEHCLNCGCPPNKIIFDSPAKTYEEIVFAVKSGVNLNANSWRELTMIQDVVAKHRHDDMGAIGVRINPLVGAGAIAALSVSTSGSKFGIPLNDENRVRIIQNFVDNDYMTCVMSHAGSQGLAVEKLTSAYKILFNLANDIDAACGNNRIRMIDIGGGLSANYDSDEIVPNFEFLVNAIKQDVPNFFKENADRGRLVATEFGKALITKCALAAAKVEDAFDTLETPVSTNAIVHSGADLFLRTAYCPDKFPHRLILADEDFVLKTGPKGSINVQGPLCFAGDVLGKGLSLPKPKMGDRIIVLDAGANTISLFSRHCSRTAPAVFGARAGKIVCIKEGEKPSDVMAFWG